MSISGFKFFTKRRGEKQYLTTGYLASFKHLCRNFFRVPSFTALVGWLILLIISNEVFWKTPGDFWIILMIEIIPYLWWCIYPWLRIYQFENVRWEDWENDLVYWEEKFKGWDWDEPTFVKIPRPRKLAGISDTHQWYVDEQGDLVVENLYTRHIRQDDCVILADRGYHSYEGRVNSFVSRQLDDLWAIYYFVPTGQRGQQHARNESVGVSGDYALLKVITEQDIYVSIAVLGETYSIEIPYQSWIDATSAGKDITRRFVRDLQYEGAKLFRNYDYNYVYEAAKLRPSMVTLTGIVDLIADEPDDEDDCEQEVAPDPSDSSPLLEPAINIGHNGLPWQFIDVAAGTLDKVRPLLKFISVPFVYPCWGSPVATNTGIERMSNARYDKYPQGVRFAKDSTLAEFYKTCATDFISLFYSKGKPKQYCSSEVHKQQPRPVQQRILKTASTFFAKLTKIFNGFVKSEAYPTPKPLRPIIETDPTVKEEYSSYTLGLAEYIKINFGWFHWYAFGRNNAEVGEAVAEKAQHASSACTTDFSAFDVTVNEFLRWFENMLIQAGYGKRAAELHKAQFPGTFSFDSVDKTQPSIKVQGYYGRHSGSAETSLFNTIVNAYVAFCTLRKMGYKPSDAWKLLGIYGGDDGITFDVNTAIYEETAYELGLTLKADTIQKGEPISFLARTYYSCAWAGTKGCSLAGPGRLLGKAHMSTRNQLTSEEALRMKSLSFRNTDGSSPIVRTWCDTIDRLCGVDTNIKDAVQDYLQGNENAIYKDVKIMDIVGYNSRFGSTCCESCVEEHLDQLSNGIFSRDVLREWQSWMALVKNLKDIPTLMLGEEEPFSATWKKLWFDRDLTTVVAEEVGTAPELPTYEERYCNVQGLFEVTEPARARRKPRGKR